MNTTNIGGNDNGKLVQTEIEPIISAEAAYEEKVKLVKKLWCQYAKLLLFGLIRQLAGHWRLRSSLNGGGKPVPRYGRN